MRKFIFFPIIAMTILALMPASAQSTELVVYSARNEHLIRPIFDIYTQRTGVEIRYITGKEAVLLQRLKTEGKNTPADLLLTVDAGNLWHAAAEGVLQPIQSQELAANIPAHLRDPENRWYGLSVRARTIVYSTERVDPAQLDSYGALAAAQWKGRLLLRTSKKVYNQSLVAMLISEIGEQAAEAVVKGWVANLAAPPFSSDTQVIEAILAGQGDVGIVNTYYFGRLQKERPDLPAALYWADQKSGGVHVNVSGAGVTTQTKKREAAVAFLEWLSSEEAQGLFAELNLEYPANPNVAPNHLVSAWGTFRQNPMNLSKAGEYQGAAVRLMDRAGYK